MKFHEYIKKLQALPEKKKLLIMFTVVGIVALIMGFFWVRSAANSFSKLESINLPKLDMPQDAIDSLSDTTGEIVDGVNQVVTDEALVGWKTYANSEYGFEIKYPGDWPVPSENMEKKEVSFNGIIFINYYKNERELIGNENTSFDEWLAENNFVMQTKEDIIFGNGYAGIKIQSSYCNGAPLLTNEIFTQTNFESFDPAQEPIYNIRGPIFDCGTDKGLININYKSLENIFDTMLSTLNFIYIAK